MNIRDNAWIYVITGGLFETEWALSMKMSNGLTDIPWTIVTVILIVMSTVLLNEGFKRGLPLGIGYAVWVGMGAVGSFILGILVMNDPVTPLRVLFAGMVIAGIIGLQYCQPKIDD